MECGVFWRTVVEFNAVFENTWCRRAMWIDTERVADAVGWNLSQVAERLSGTLRRCFCGGARLL